MFDLRYKPYWLPQVSAPYTYTLDMLEKEKVGFSIIEIDPEELIPTQGIVDLVKLKPINNGEIKPIWISAENKILDGHHRYASSLSRGNKQNAIKIDLPAKDAARLLNKIQDIYEYEMENNINEVVAQNQINAMNDVSFLEMLESEMADDKEILHDDNVKIVGKKVNKQKGYRKTPMNEKSSVGNFFLTKPIEGYIEYDIEFDNLLDTNDMEIIYKKDESPVFILAKNWFPNINFSKIAKKHGVSPDALINKAIAEKAKLMGYDGIKYGDIMIQGLK
jgi:hypothetical protein